MIRVRSRPRLVSFDGDQQWKNVNVDTAINHRNSSGKGAGTDSFMRRKSKSSIIRNINLYNEIVIEVTSDLDVLCDDILIQAIKFLCAEDVRSVRLTNSRLHRLSQKFIVWESHMKKQWPVFDEWCNKENVDITLCDDYCSSSPIKISGSCSKGNLSTTNYPLLHGISQNYPISFHDRYFAANDFFVKGSNGMVTFNGEVGIGDRSLMSDVPFPSFSLLKVFERCGQNAYALSFPHSIMNLMTPRRGRGRPDRTLSFNQRIKSVTHLPFVSPYVSKIVLNEKTKKTNLSINVTPRLVAYYEVTIHEKRSEDGALGTNIISEEENLIDCVAVGIATDRFNEKHKMPGWDNFSYGYHGDDGGIFHARGDMVKQYGPKFGVGDTVGCGINFANNGIFFTLNGIFLGYAWLGVCTQRPFYASVGVDSNFPISANFGRIPFKFDLTSFHEQYCGKVISMLRVEARVTGKNSRLCGSKPSSDSLNSSSFSHGPGCHLLRSASLND
uniref:B30.2/SPRY domain-containing protein n=1 Tax=Leptocylindrus aporus TaxID=1398097 RepID=A0A7S0PIR2_9STRA|mmetsp:Transcript_1534/g.2090  ORF Transcript_1534/g.2090 Transcript_1534/m.2090 type:complete len:499 (+) Transcript_1534:157-1653(+)|eukprot:CAMPEP_0116064820 /NCGR_PEP_ID=MMETSP0322-20121206/9348_1 /TAXON_ID=163516 /ORGANISM="Leptocylindrus danicus var. apora, Strain B651" /LENGTH=498 /DNA_ID=CAMNT_0003550923 /DNA_START=133 /DNA_END=1629 /DNA_ORIENTATION=+